jgi:hypothetical protein
MECIKIETNPIVKENLTILEMKAEIERLTQENQMLKQDKLELHNIIENRNAVDSVKNNDDPSLLGDYESELPVVDYEAYANAFKNVSLNRM